MYNRTLGSRLWIESGETEAYVVWIKTDDLGGWAGLEVRRKKIGPINSQRVLSKIVHLKAVRYAGQKIYI